MKILTILLFLCIAINSSLCDSKEELPVETFNENLEEKPEEFPESEPAVPTPSPDTLQSFTDEKHTHVYDPVECTLSPPPTLEELSQVYEWADKYKKKYATARKRLCATIKVCYHLRQVTHHNKLYEAGVVSFKEDLTQYSDWSQDEKDEHLLMKDLEEPPVYRQRPQVLPVLPPAREYVNWVEEGLVQPVGIQYNCGSCYAFSGAPPLEAQLKRCNIFNEPVSIQQMVNCPTIGVWGCQSGWPFWVYRWQMSGGIVPAAAFPYTDTKGACAYNSSDIIAYVHQPFKFDFTNLGGNASFIKQVVSAIGPVAAVICVEGNLYQYSSGVYKNPTCCTTLKHAVAIVGYGTDPIGGDYWLIKNSWGDWWGDKGYAKIERGSNTCIIETQIQYAQVRSVNGTVCKFPYQS